MRNRTEYFKQWRKNNIDKVRAIGRRYRKNHPEKQREWKLKNREKVNAYARKQYRKNPQNTRIWEKNHPWCSIFRGARYRCRPDKCYGKRGILFNITQDEVKYLWFRDKAFLMKQPSIDRIQIDGNYNIENCRFIELIENKERKRFSGWLKYKICKLCKNDKNRYHAKGLCFKCYREMLRKKYPERSY